MAETFRKDRLDYKISELGIYLDEDVKWTNENLIKRLGDYTLAHTKDYIPWSTKYVQSLECVMLCKHLKDEMKNFTAETNPMVSPDYIAENKENGFRHLMCYSPKDGFTLYSRKESVDTYLNTNFTDKILFIKDGLIKEPKDFINKLNYRFVLDGEIIVNSDGANFEGVQYESIEDYVQAVLGSNAERAKAFQKDGHRLIFKIFDVLYFEKDAKEHEEIDFKFDYSAKEPNEEEIAWIEKYYEKYLTSTGYKLEGKLTGKNKKLYTYLRTLKYLPKYDVRRYPFWKRRELRDQLISMLQKIGIPAEEVAHEDVNKIEFLDSILRNSGEGCILKQLNAPYIAGMKSSRSHKACLKVKQNMANILDNLDKVEDFDVFITSANPPKSDRIKDMIGSLNCSIYIIDEDGQTREHQIASVTGISHEWKRKFAKVDPVTGEITLNPEYLNKVIAINGLALTATNLKFQHAVIKDRNAIEFKAKQPTECVWEENVLKEMTLVRGR